MNRYFKEFEWSDWLLKISNELYNNNSNKIINWNMKEIISVLNHCLENINNNIQTDSQYKCDHYYINLLLQIIIELRIPSVVVMNKLVINDRSLLYYCIFQTYFRYKKMETYEFPYLNLSQYNSLKTLFYEMILYLKCEEDVIYLIQWTRIVNNIENEAYTYLYNQIKHYKLVELNEILSVIIIARYLLRNADFMGSERLLKMIINNENPNIWHLYNQQLIDYWLNIIQLQRPNASTDHLDNSSIMIIEIISFLKQSCGSRSKELCMKIEKMLTNIIKEYIHDMNKDDVLFDMQHLYHQAIHNMLTFRREKKNLQSEQTVLANFILYESLFGRYLYDSNVEFLKIVNVKKYLNNQINKLIASDELNYVIKNRLIYLQKMLPLYNKNMFNQFISKEDIIIPIDFKFKPSFQSKWKVSLANWYRCNGYFREAYDILHMNNDINFDQYPYIRRFIDSKVTTNVKAVKHASKEEEKNIPRWSTDNLCADLYKCMPSDENAFIIVWNLLESIKNATDLSNGYHYVFDYTKKLLELQMLNNNVTFYARGQKIILEYVTIANRRGSIKGYIFLATAAQVLKKIKLDVELQELNPLVDLMNEMDTQNINRTTRRLLFSLMSHETIFSHILDICRLSDLDEKLFKVSEIKSKSDFQKLGCYICYDRMCNLTPSKDMSYLISLCNHLHYPQYAMYFACHFIASNFESNLGIVVREVVNALMDLQDYTLALLFVQKLDETKYFDLVKDITQLPIQFDVNLFPFFYDATIIELLYHGIKNENELHALKLALANPCLGSNSRSSSDEYYFREICWNNILSECLARYQLPPKHLSKNIFLM